MAKPAKAQKTPLPADFGISDRVRAWAAEKGFTGLDQHLEVFRGKALARAYTYADWDEGFMGATRADDGTVLPFDPARDLAQLMAQAQAIAAGGHPIRLVILDPVVSVVTGDSHKNTEVRRALQPVVDMAASLGASVLGISHFSKGSAGRDPTERVTGSVAFGAMARVVLVAAVVKDEATGEGPHARAGRARTGLP